MNWPCILFDETRSSGHPAVGRIELACGHCGIHHSAPQALGAVEGLVKSHRFSRLKLEIHLAEIPRPKGLVEEGDLCIGQAVFDSIVLKRALSPHIVAHGGTKGVINRNFSGNHW